MVTGAVKVVDAAVPARREAAARLTRVLESHSAASFIRLGDGEVWYLEQVQDGHAPPKYRYLEKVASVELARSTSGMESRHRSRFVDALEHATFLDYCDSIPRVADALPRLRFSRDPRKWRNRSPSESNILFEWTWFEFRDYIARHRCLIASAEAALLRELREDEGYLEIAREFWPADAEVFFHQIRDDGRHYSENLDLIANDLRMEIARHNVDSLFLSLGTGAKILCYELAREMKIRAIDFGSMTRALAYAGTAGYQSSRNQHNPFMFRVPLNVFMPALERAHPEMTRAERLVRAQAQLILNVQRLRPLSFNPPDAIAGSAALDLSDPALQRFREDLRFYNRFYRPRIWHDPECVKLHRIFVRWRWKAGIGIAAVVFRLLVKAKALLRKILGDRPVPVENHENDGSGGVGASPLS